MLRATTACTFSKLNFQKWSDSDNVLYIFTWKCASRHNGVHFFDISTSKSGPRIWCALYILTSKCASRHNGVHFFDIATSKVVRTCCVLYMLTAKCASRHNGVISHLASWLRTRRFSEPTFRPSGLRSHKSQEKHSVSRLSVFHDVPTFSRTCIFFLLILSLLTLITSAFQLSILSEV